MAQNIKAVTACQWASVSKMCLKIARGSSQSTGNSWSSSTQASPAAVMTIIQAEHPLLIHGAPQQLLLTLSTNLPSALVFGWWHSYAIKGHYKVIVSLLTWWSMHKLFEATWNLWALIYFNFKKKKLCSGHVASQSNWHENGTLCNSSQLCCCASHDHAEESFGSRNQVIGQKAHLQPTGGPHNVMWQESTMGIKIPGISNKLHFA